MLCPALSKASALATITTGMLVLLAAVFPAVAQRANEAALRPKVMQFINQHHAETGLPREKGEKISIRFIDLNADGTTEAFVIIRSSTGCGSRGCPAFVLDLRGAAARSIGDLIAERLEALTSKTGEWRDIAVNGNRIQFRGGRYGGSSASGGSLGSLPTFKDCADCPEMVVLPAGSYWMGATEEDKKIAFADWGNKISAARGATFSLLPCLTARQSVTEIVLADLRECLK